MNAHRDAQTDVVLGVATIATEAEVAVVVAVAALHAADVLEVVAATRVTALAREGVPQSLGGAHRDAKAAIIDVVTQLR